MVQFVYVSVPFISVMGRNRYGLCNNARLHQLLLGRILILQTERTSSSHPS